MADADWTETDRVTAEGNPRRPEGAAGRAMLARMNESHARLVDWGLAQITLHAGDIVLDIGCGGGNTLARMAECVTQGHLVGIDYAETSVEASRAFNAPLIEAGRMEILHASVEALPFDDVHFDEIVTVESFYFWPNPAESLKEVARVLKPGGTLLIGLEASDPTDTTWTSRIDNMRIYSPEELVALLQEAGFSDIKHKELEKTKLTSTTCIIGRKER